MKNLIFMLVLVGCFLPQISKAAVDEHVLVRGQVANVWTKEKVKVTDQFDQTYYLPRAVFPKNFIFQSGKAFTVEITDQQLDQIVLIK